MWQFYDSLMKIKILFGILNFNMQKLSQLKSDGYGTRINPGKRIIRLFR